MTTGFLVTSQARHNVPLAQQVVAELEDAACGGRGLWWSRQESRHAKASTAAEAAAATRPALRLCRRCPAYEACEQWAQLDDYTGLAAGSVYINGRRRKPDSVIQRPVPPRSAA